VPPWIFLLAPEASENRFWTWQKADGGSWLTVARCASMRLSGFESQLSELVILGFALYTREERRRVSFSDFTEGGEVHQNWSIRDDQLGFWKYKGISGLQIFWKEHLIWLWNVPSPCTAGLHKPSTHLSKPPFNLSTTRAVDL